MTAYRETSTVSHLLTTPASKGKIEKNPNNPNVQPVKTPETSKKPETFISAGNYSHNLLHRRPLVVLWFRKAAVLVSTIWMVVIMLLES